MSDGRAVICDAASGFYTIQVRDISYFTYLYRL